MALVKTQDPEVKAYVDAEGNGLRTSGPLGSPLNNMLFHVCRAANVSHTILMMPGLGSCVQGPFRLAINPPLSSSSRITYIDNIDKALKPLAREQILSPSPPQCTYSRSFNSREEKGFRKQKSG